MALPKPGPTRSPRLTIVDAMILVAATALGLAFLRALRREVVGYLSLHDHHFLRSQVQLLLTSWMCGFLIVSVKRLREPSWRMMRRPGLLACVVAPAAALLGSLLWATALYLPRRFSEPDLYLFSVLPIYFISESSLDGGLAILFAWTTLLLTGTWRPSADWGDRSGRVLGLASIALWLCDRLRL